MIAFGGLRPCTSDPGGTCCTCPPGPCRHGAQRTMGASERLVPRYPAAPDPCSGPTACAWPALCEDAGCIAAANDDSSSGSPRDRRSRAAGRRLWLALRRVLDDVLAFGVGLALAAAAIALWCRWGP
jgi:hypothetical protein